MFVVCYDTCACVGACGSVYYWCAGTPHSSFILGLCCCCCCRIMLSVSHRASSSQALYCVAATVQQQSHSKFVWTTTYYTCVDSTCMRVFCVRYDTCVCRRVQVCAYVCWNPPLFQLLFFVFLLCFIAAYCPRIMSVSYRASSSQALYYVVATVPDQSYRKFAWTTSMRVLTFVYAWV